MAFERCAGVLGCATLGALPLLLGACTLPLIGPYSDRTEPVRRTAVSDIRPHRALLAKHSGEECYAALAREGVAFERVAPGEALGVDTPARLLGPLHGVEVVAHGSGERVHTILDCRLALALLSWAPALRDAGVVRLEHYSIYRPRARNGRRVSGHARGLAIDAARFQLRSGEVLDVLTDWEERERGSAPCPRRPDESWPSRLLRSVVCEAVESQLFQVVITPHHDRAHDNHVHLELKPEVNWTYVR